MPGIKVCMGNDCMTMIVVKNISSKIVCYIIIDLLYYYLYAIENGSTLIINAVKCMVFRMFHNHAAIPLDDNNN